MMIGSGYARGVFARAAVCLLMMLGWLGSPRSAWAGTDEEPSRLTIAASSEMAELVQRLGDAFKRTNDDATIETTALPKPFALSALENGKANLVALARPLTEAERNRLKAPRQPSVLGVPIAISAGVVVVHPQHRCRQLTVHQAFRVLAGAVGRWEQLGVDGTDVLEPVGDTNSVAPDSSGPDAHGHDRAKDESPRVVVLRPPADGDLVSAWTIRSTPGLAPPDYREGMPLDGIAQRVAAEPLSIGVTEFGRTRGAQMVAISSSASSEAVAPTPESIRDRRYPLAYYVYLYVPADAPEEVWQFVSFALSASGQQVVADSSVYLPLAAPSPKDE